MLIPWVLFLAICFVVFKSIYDFIRANAINIAIGRESYFSMEIFAALLLIYVIVMIGYGLVYFILSFQGIILVENGELRQVSIIGSIIHSIYFSGVTLLTIGYGDITPIGLGRFIALSEALIGYILPAAFVLKIVQAGSRSRDK
ncbi:potassium channel family protein [Oceanobacillus massiliensis]|uniref:potassium channel family protein n=1 Tax=Oceanobacillus massiliensis TaxID=1465765 RepID=UPI0002887C97|nr:potassium channel family protein [Oceanobacillus massiliensis]